jgi:hypothetical protein
MLALCGLKWNPFTPNVPTEALHVTRVMWWQGISGRCSQLKSQHAKKLTNKKPPR